MPQDYPVQIGQVVALSAKTLRFQQTAIKGEKLYCEDTKQEYIALNTAGDKSGSFSLIENNAGYAQFTTAAVLPSLGDTIQIMSSASGDYIGNNYIVTGLATGKFTLNVAFAAATTTGYWKREATIVIPSKLQVKVESTDYSGVTKRHSTNSDTNSLIYNTFAGDFQYVLELDSVFNHQISTEIVLVSDNNLVVVTFPGGTLVDRRTINQTARLIKVLPNKWLMVNF